MEWCIRMVVVAKKLGKPCYTVDFQKLNVCCQWEMHHIPTHSTWPLESHCILSRQWLTCTRVITWYILMKKVTTLPSSHPGASNRIAGYIMGHYVAGDACTKRFDDIIVILTRKYKYIDDTHLYDTSVEEAF